MPLYTAMPAAGSLLLLLPMLTMWPRPAARIPGRKTLMQCSPARMLVWIISTQLAVSPGTNL